jgi:hypothetical protein
VDEGSIADLFDPPTQCHGRRRGDHVRDVANALGYHLLLALLVLCEGLDARWQRLRRALPVQQDGRVLHAAIDQS